MTDLASLLLKVDSSDVEPGVKSLDRLTEAGTRAEKSVERLGATSTRATTVIRGVTASAGQQRAGMQQLSFQIGDVAQQFALGTNPMIIFAQQGGQVVQSIALMRSTAGGFIGFMAGPWGAALLGATMILGALMTSQNNAADASDNHKDAAEELAKATDDLNDAINREMRSTQASIQIDMTKAASLRARAVEARKAAIAELELQKAALGANLAQAGRFAGDNSGGTGARGGSYALAGINESNISALDAEIKRQQGIIDKNNQTITLNQGKMVGLLLEESFDGAAKATGNFSREQDRLNKELTSGRITLDQYAVGLRSAMATRERDIASSRSSTRASREKKEAISEEQKAYEAALKSAQGYLASLEEETAKIGKNATEIKRMDVAAAAAAAQKAAALAPTAAGTEALRAEAFAILAAGDAWQEAYSKQAATDFQNNIIRPLEIELALLGLTGAARDAAALALEKEAFVAKNGATAWEQYFNAKSKVIAATGAVEAQKKAMEDARKAADDLRDSYTSLISALDQLGGMGSALGDVFGVLYGIQSGDFTGVRGKFGGILQLLSRNDGVSSGLQGLTKKLDGIFGGTGSFTAMMQSTVPQVAAIMAAQSAIGNLLGNSEIKNGGILNHIIGPFATALFGSAKRGAASIGGTGSDFSLDVTGNTGKYKKASSAAATSVIDSLLNIAEQLGGGVDASLASVSIGIRKGNYRVDPTGQGRTKAKNGVIDFGKDEAAAIAYAIQEAIRDGVITGLRAGTKALISASGDIEAQVAKAMKFEGVFKELKQRADPLAYALETLGTELESLKKIFAEAGASAAEYADLEKLFQLKREEAMKSAADEALEKARDRRGLEIRIMELQGNAAAALAAARELEIEKMDAALRPLQRIIFQMEDLREKADQFAALATGLRSYRDSLFASDVAAGNAYAKARGQFLATAALAAGGDVKGLSSLEGVSGDFLTASRNNASTLAQYQRDVAAVVGAVDRGIFAAAETADYAQLQLDALASSVSLLTSIDANIAAIVPANQTPAPIAGAPAGTATPDNTAMANQLAQLQAGQSAMAADIAKTNAAMLRFYNRWEGEGLLVRTDADTPLNVVTE